MTDRTTQCSREAPWLWCTFTYISLITTSTPPRHYTNILWGNTMKAEVCAQKPCVASTGQPSGSGALSLSGSLSPHCHPFKNTTVAFVQGHQQKQMAIVSCCNFRQTSSTGETAQGKLAFDGFTDLVSLFLSFPPVLWDPAIFSFLPHTHPPLIPFFILPWNQPTPLSSSHYTQSFIHLKWFNILCWDWWVCVRGRG